MRIKNHTNLLLILAIAVAATLGCKSIMPASGETQPSNTAPTNSASNNTTSSGPKVEKADFTVKSEEFDKEFHKDGVTDADLEKYANKNIAVTGRVSMLVTEKKGTVQPWVTLYAPGILRGVNCYFDDENVGQMSKLKMDKMVKIQGFMDDFIVPKISPRLDHCIVLEGAE